MRLLSVGAVVPRKGFDVLIAALATLADLPWRLTIAGDRTRDPTGGGAARCRYRASSSSAIAVTLLGAVSPRRICRSSTCEADLFVLASRFEGYGMAYAEAHRARPAGDRHHGRRHSRHGAGRRRPAGRARTIVGACRRRCGRSSSDAERAQCAWAAPRGAAARQLPTWRAVGEIFARALEALA